MYNNHKDGNSILMVIPIMSLFHKFRKREYN